MSRTPKSMPEPVADAMTDERMAEAEQNVQELTVITRKHSAEVSLLASQLGYDGDLSVGSLEDSIRFYQKQEIDVWLSLGKRLLLLKEQVGHGEFQTRIELLGFSYRTAARYMQAAAKSTKSATVALLANQVKSFRAFAEIIMIDDEDTLKAISELDDIDRMPASELRRLVRGLKDTQATDEKILAGKDQEIRALKRKALAQVDWPDAFKGYISQVQGAANTIKVQIGALDIVREAAMKIEAATPEEEAGLQKAREVLATELLRIHRNCAEYLEAMGHSFDQTLGNFADGSR